MTSLWIIFASILIVFIVSRLITFMVLKWKVLPKNTLSNGRRVHHFVYGNVLILLASFLSIGLCVVASNIFIAIAYGLGLGLILDEFPHWLGNVKELTRSVPIIPGAIPAIIFAEVVILLVIILKAFAIL